MNILIVGGGGREHALAWKVASSKRVTRVFVAPGNAGTLNEEKVKNIDLDAEDINGLKEFALTNNIDLTIIGPEAPLVKGIVDTFQAAHLRCFGPSKGAAQLEGSKAFTKDFLNRQEIPTAAYGNFTDIEEASAYIKKAGAPIVIKADGLAAGKGVILATTVEQAITAVEDMLAGNAFGDAGHRVVVEEFLTGEEASFICMVDGEHVLPLATSQDHKARDNGDLGPNTGGMGAYSPAPVVTREVHERIMKEIIEPTVKGMANEGNPYHGFLYAGVMIDVSGVPKVLEFNCRFGDPETQPIMMRLQSDLTELIDAALDNKLNEISAKWDPCSALGVVMAAGGYPDSYKKGDVITGLSSDRHAGELEKLKIFHAGTAEKNSEIVTNGGRVLCVTALGESVADAQRLAYECVSRVHWQNAYFRTDIGYRAVAKEKKYEGKSKI